MSSSVSLVRLVIHDLIAQYQLSPKKAMDIFYSSETAKEFNNKNSWIFTYAPEDIAAMIMDENRSIR
jgi:hypothetical protein